MTLTYHRMGCVAAATIAALAGPVAATAQPYPNRPVRIILANAPGSSADVIARLIGSKLSERIGQTVIVDPRPGASGVVAVEMARNAPPDGYTLLLAGNTNFATLPALRSGLPYDIDKDFVGLTRVASVAHVVAVHPSLGVSTVADLVRLAKGRPGQLNYGSGGNGSTSHLAAEMFNVLAGLKTVHVPYKGIVLAFNDLIGGQLQFIISSPISALPHAATGRIRMIATTGAKRDPLLPELPTVADTVPGFDSTLWWGMAVPAKTHGDIVMKLRTEIVKVLQSQDVRESLAKHGATAHAESPAEFTASIRAERERIARVGRQVGITFD